MTRRQVPSTPCPYAKTSQFIAEAFITGHQATIDTGGSNLQDDHWLDLCHSARADFVSRMGSNLSLPMLGELGQRFGCGAD
jgi:hypothetical protein